MNWRDFLYFSKGERRALTILLALITITWIILLCGNKNSPDNVDNKIESINKNPGTILPKNKEITPAPTKSIKAKKELIKKRNWTNRPSSYKQFPKTEKFPPGTTIEMNAADTTMLKKIPGIGSVFANRIVKYRNILGGFHSIEQLNEVYGIDEERYEAMKSWFTVDSTRIRKLYVNTAPFDSINRHPYINYQQAKTIVRLRNLRQKLNGWESLTLLEEFPKEEQIRLIPYLSFD